MSSFIDLEDEELINADENELYEENGINAGNCNNEAQYSYLTLLLLSLIRLR